MLDGGLGSPRRCSAAPGRCPPKRFLGKYFPVPRPRFTSKTLTLCAHSNPIKPVEHYPAAPPIAEEAVASIEGPPAL